MNKTIKTSEKWLSPEDYYDILKNWRSYEHLAISTPPVKPSPGDVYLYVNEKKVEDWKSDQYRWVDNSKALIPKSEPKILCHYYIFDNGKDHEPRANKNFQRRAYILFKEKGIKYDAVTLIHYCGSLKDITVNKHGNRKFALHVPHIRTAKSVLIKEKTKLTAPPQETYMKMVGADVHPALVPVLEPRDRKQVNNAIIRERVKKSLSDDDLQAVLLMDQHLPGYIRKYDLIPHTLIILIHEKQAAFFAEISHLEDTILFYDTTFCLGDFNLSVLSYKCPIFEEEPAIPLAYIMHDSKEKLLHEEFFNRCKNYIPQIVGVCIVTDREQGIVSAISSELPENPHFMCWNHIRKDVERWARQNKSCTPNDVEIYCSNTWDLLDSESEKEFLAKYDDVSSLWSPAFKDYFDKYVFKDIKSNGKWILLEYNIYKPRSGITTNSAESLNAVLKRFLKRKEVKCDVMVMSLYHLDLNYVREIVRGRCSLGNYHLSAKYLDEFQLEIRTLEKMEYPTSQFNVEELPYVFERMDVPKVPPKVNDRGEVLFSNFAIARDLQARGKVKLISEIQSYAVSGEKENYLVTLYPEPPKCTCRLKRNCHHIQAVFLSQGNDNIKNKKVKISKIKKKVRGFRAGRKKTPKNVIEVSPAKDSIASSLSSKNSTNCLLLPTITPEDNRVKKRFSALKKKRESKIDDTTPKRKKISIGVKKKEIDSDEELFLPRKKKMPVETEKRRNIDVEDSDVDYDEELFLPRKKKMPNEIEKRRNIDVRESDVDYDEEHMPTDRRKSGKEKAKIVDKVNDIEYSNGLREPENILLKNGILCGNLEWKENCYVKLVNTCAFDSSCQIVAQIIIEDPRIIKCIQRSKNLFLQTAYSLAIKGAELDTYKLRMDALIPYYKTCIQKKQDNPTNIESITKKEGNFKCEIYDCECAAGSLINYFFRPGSEMTFLNVSTNIRFSDLNNLQREIITDSKTQLRNYLFVDVSILYDDMNDGNRSNKFEYQLDLLPEQLTVLNESYNLKGVVAHQSDHYVSYCKNRRGAWSCYNDMGTVPVELKILRKVKIRPHLLFYTSPQTSHISEPCFEDSAINKESEEEIGPESFFAGIKLSSTIIEDDSPKENTFKSSSDEETERKHQEGLENVEKRGKQTKRKNSLQNKEQEEGNKKKAENRKIQEHEEELGRDKEQEKDEHEVDNLVKIVNNRLQNMEKDCQLNDCMEYKFTQKFKNNKEFHLMGKKIRRKDLSCLIPEKSSVQKLAEIHVNAEVINFYLTQLIYENRYKLAQRQISIFIIECNILSQLNFKLSVQYFLKYDVPVHEITLYPFIENNHICLCIVLLKKKMILYLDPKHDVSEVSVKHLTTLIKCYDSFYNIRGIPTKVAKWEIRAPADIPRLQQYSFDSGIFVMLFAELLVTQNLHLLDIIDSNDLFSYRAVVKKKIFDILQEKFIIPLPFKEKPLDSIIDIDIEEPHIHADHLKISTELPGEPTLEFLIGILDEHWESTDSICAECHSCSRSKKDPLMFCLGCHHWFHRSCASEKRVPEYFLCKRCKK